MFKELEIFRQKLYGELGRSKAALFDLMDALLTTPATPSLVQVSLSPLFRRQWSSAFKAIENFRWNSNSLMRWLLQFVVVGEGMLVMVLDHTPWARLYAKTLKERTIEHQPTVVQGNKPITVGHGYSTLAVIPEMEGSWVLPLRHERITSFETPITKGVFQLKQACRHLSKRPLLLADSEYANAKFLKATIGVEADLLMRLRPNRVLYGPPPAYSGKGRPRVDGARFALKEYQDWPQADQYEEVVDSQKGRIRIRLWSQLHFRQSPQVPFSTLCVEYLDHPRQSPLWLMWKGQTELSLNALREFYQRRFTIEHWNRLAKQRLHWTLPLWGSTQQGERWSRLLLLLSWQLWFARDELLGAALLWQKPQTLPSPGRVAQNFIHVLACIGSPAPDPKPRGKGKGCPLGEARRNQPSRPFVRKRAKRPPKKAA